MTQYLQRFDTGHTPDDIKKLCSEKLLGPIRSGLLIGNSIFAKSFQEMFNHCNNFAYLVLSGRALEDSEAIDNCEKEFDRELSFLVRACRQGEGVSQSAAGKPGQTGQLGLRLDFSGFFNRTTGVQLQ